MARIEINGYGQLELNQVAFRRDGRIEAQCKLDDKIEYVENGMLLAIDNTKRTVSFPKADGTDEFIALNYTSEHMYDERKTALKDFRLEKNTFLPRLGYLAAGDKFTTNTVSYDGTLDDLKTAIAAGTIYGCESTDGSILCGAKDDSKKICLKALYETTMPDGTFAIKFQVVSC